MRMNFLTSKNWQMLFEIDNKSIGLIGMPAAKTSIGEKIAKLRETAVYRHR